MSLRLLALGGLLCIVGCAMPIARYHVETRYDKFDNYEIVETTRNFLPGAMASSSADIITLNARRFIPQSGAAKYLLVLDYAGKSWVFVDSGESLVLLINGERFGLSGKGSRDHTDVFSGGVSETAFYELGYDDLVRIGNAKTVEMKVIGSDRTIRKELSKENIEILHRFAAEYPPDGTHLKSR